MILKLKKLNQSMEYQHFKMESIKNVIDVIQPGCYMASVDLKDAFFTIPINKNHKIFLKFYHRKQLYQFDAMPNGYGPAMRIFTKVTKVPFSHLRSKRHISVVYVDDSYLQGSTFDSCRDNVDDTLMYPCCLLSGSSIWKTFLS